MNSVAARSVSRAVTPRLSGLLVAALCVVTPAASQAGVDGADHMSGPIAARAKFMAANELIATTVVLDKAPIQKVDGDSLEVAAALTTYLELHGRALDAARATLMPLMVPVPQ